MQTSELTTRDYQARTATPFKSSVSQVAGSKHSPSSTLQLRSELSGVVIQMGDILNMPGNDLPTYEGVRVQRKHGWRWSGLPSEPGRTVTLPTGDVLVIVVAEQRTSAWGQPPDAVSVVVSIERVNRLLLLHSLDMAGFADRDVVGPDCSTVISTVMEMWARSGTGRAVDRLHLEALLRRLIALIHPGDVSETPADSRDDPRLVRVLNYLEANLEGRLSVSGMADVAGMSEAHFARRFRAVLGESAWAYVQRRRAEQAFEMLLSSSEGLAEVAFACGYANQAHMTTSLKQRYGTTPGAIRKGRKNSREQDYSR